MSPDFILEIDDPLSRHEIDVVHDAIFSGTVSPEGGSVNGRYRGSVTTSDVSRCGGRYVDQVDEINIVNVDTNYLDEEEETKSFIEKGKICIF